MKNDDLSFSDQIVVFFGLFELVFHGDPVDRFFQSHLCPAHVHIRIIQPCLGALLRFLGPAQIDFLFGLNRVGQDRRQIVFKI